MYCTLTPVLSLSTWKVSVFYPTLISSQLFVHPQAFYSWYFESVFSSQYYLAFGPHLFIHHFLVQRIQYSLASPQNERKLYCSRQEEKIKRGVD
jgi:hypothetical protein